MMTSLTLYQSSGGTVGAILLAMALLALIETAIPLHARGRWNRAHLGPNLALTFMTFATNILLNGALVMTLVALESGGFGLLRLFALPPLIVVAAVVLALDFSFYVAHVAMHKIPGFWRFHSVHHSDPAVDVTTTIRQHPVEGVIRYAFMAAFAIPLGASPAAFAVYRVWSALSGLLEHSNIRVPRWLDSLLSLVFSWPNMHKVHHSRDARYTDTNYGNIVSLWDRLFFTFTAARNGANIVYGLDGFDDPSAQTTLGLLVMPFREARAPREAAATTQEPAGAKCGPKPSASVSTSTATL
jgi:sterol desaturase/sphingolipid hydroxylase (fatty acid hydroxylase superfamily)